MKRTLILAIIALAAVLAVFGRIHMVKGERESRREGIETINRREGYPVVTTAVEVGPFAVWREIQGRVMGSVEAHLQTADPSRIKSIEFKIGDMVPADTPIIRLDVDDPQNMTRVNLARELYEEYKSDHESYKRLHAKGVLQKDAVDKSKIQMDAAKADLDMALSAVDLISPIPGVLTKLTVRVGERAESNTTLAIVSDLDKVRIQANISDTDVVEMKEGQDVAVTAADGTTMSGTVDRVSIGADPYTSLFDLEMMVDNKNQALKIGTFAAAKVKVFDEKEAVSVPSRCVLRDLDDSQYIYQVKDGKAVKVPVRVETVNEDRSVVSGEGLDPKLPAVLRGKTLLRDGVKIRVQEDLGESKTPKADKAEAEGE